MIEHLYNSPRLLHQTPALDNVIAEPPIAGSVDAGGMIVISQECRQICMSKESIRELCKMLRMLEKESP